MPRTKVPKKVRYLSDEVEILDREDRADSPYKSRYTALIMDHFVTFLFKSQLSLMLNPDSIISVLAAAMSQLAQHGYVLAKRIEGIGKAEGDSPDTEFQQWKLIGYNDFGKSGLHLPFFETQPHEHGAYLIMVTKDRFALRLDVRSGSYDSDGKFVSVYVVDEEPFVGQISGAAEAFYED